ncbi:peptidylprolyl isomerase [Paenibacillus sp. LHD-117]|uniref:foldase protein PrsA n=1 Tax=Paenibacillus sp. LHD-117 TaxID=3071412 RepID=UPI0027E16E2F|nr:peptidylprolyl isomerase [Paenibacillus sp. LHD-117]MDQ6423193.1 peptidylprolyl isomerase [Paenibacillus sp. LHD-117]
MSSHDETRPNEKKTDIGAEKEERYTYDQEQEENELTEAEELTDEEFYEDEADDDARKETAAAAAAVAAPAALASTPASPAKKGGGLGWIVLSAVLVIALIVVLIKPPFGGGSNDAVATVNGTKITKDQLYDTLVKANGAAALDNLILENLVQQEADAASISITDQDITDEIEAIKLQFGTEEAFQGALAQNGYTMEALRADMKISAMIRKVLESKTDVTDEEVKAYFDENKATLGGNAEQVRASHILVDTKEEADAILAELKAGADFAETAKAKSKDGSAANGGDLDFFGRGQMVAEFEEAAFALEVGQISEVVKSEFGYHIIKKTDYKAAVEPNFEEKKAAIRTLLVGQEARTLSETWIEEIRGKAKITNTLEPAASDAPAATDAPAGEGETTTTE